MTNDRSSSPETQSSSVRRRAGLLSLSLIIAVAWLGCSVEKHYDLLSFFFDGVPDPNFTLESDPEAFVLRTGGKFFMHQPFANDNCGECHANPAELNLSRDDSSMCLKCHESTLAEYTFMHGATVGMACLWCHDPHRSPYENLLRAQPPELCRQCHNPSLTSRPEVSEHVQTETECLECHSGHGGSSRYFLKSSIE